MDKRITLISAPGPWSGVEVHTIRLVEELIKFGVAVTIVEVGKFNHYNHSSVSKSISYIGLPDDGCRITNKSFNARHFYYWRKLLKRLESDLIIVVKGYFDFGNINLYLAAKMSCRSLIAIEHMHQPLMAVNSDSPLKNIYKNWWRRKAQLRGYIRSTLLDTTICVSDACRQTLINDYLYKDERTFVFHSGVDTSLYQPSKEIRARVLSKLNIPDDSIIFGSVSRLSPMKNHRMMIEAFSKVRAQNPDDKIHLIIVGEGPLSDSLRKQASEEGNVNEFVHFVGFTDSPWEYYPAFNFFCLSSYIGEAFPLALLEAMACENRPIATDVGGVRESFTNEVGWLVQPNDCNAFAHAMNSAVQNLKSTNCMMVSPREYVQIHFDSQEKTQSLARFLVEKR